MRADSTWKTLRSGRARWPAVLALLFAAPASAQNVSVDATADTYLKSGSANKNQGERFE